MTSRILAFLGFVALTYMAMHMTDPTPTKAVVGFLICSGLLTASAVMSYELPHKHDKHETIHQGKRTQALEDRRS